MSSRISNLELSDSDESSVFSVPDHARPAAVPLLDSAGTLLSVNSHSPLFGTPRSSRSDGGTTGGGRANVTLFYCKRAMSVCRGYITTDEGIRFCCKSASECTIMKHQATKASLRDGFLYVKAPRADQGAYLEPAVALSSVPESDRTDLDALLARKNMRPLWLTFFQACESAVTAPIGSMKLSPKQEAKPTPRLECFTRAETNLQTPRGLRITTFASDTTPFESIGDASPGALYEEMLDLDSNFLNRQDNEEDVELAMLESLHEEWPKIRRNFGALSRDLATLGSESWAFRKDVRSGFNDINDFIEEMGIQIQLINNRLGEDGPASDYANSTIWEALEKLQNMGTHVSHKVQGFNGQIEGLESLVTTHKVEAWILYNEAWKNKKNNATFSMMTLMPSSKSTKGIFRK
jgi:hypothetical protein